MKGLARIGVALLGALALVVSGCSRDLSGPAGGLAALAAKGGNGGGHGGGPGGGGGGPGGGGGGGDVAAQLTIAGGPLSFADQGLSGSYTAALTSDDQGAYPATIGVSSADPNGRLVLTMSAHGKSARCADIALRLVAGNPADLPRTGCETVTMFTNSRSTDGCGGCDTDGFTDLTSEGQTALQGGSVRWPHGNNDEWVVVLDPSQPQLDACAAGGIGTSDLSPRGQGVLIRLVSNNADGTRTWSVEPQNENGHFYGLLRSVNGSQCIAIVDFPLQLTVTG